MNVAELLKTYMKEHGYTQTSIAEKSGIEIKTLNAILNGNVRLTVDRFEAVCKAMNVDPSFFIGKNSKRIGILDTESEVSHETET